MVKIVFLHPDLGIGGAERLVVDAAIALKQKGHNVSFVTNHHSPEHCFEETRDGTLKVDVVGDWLPRKLFGRFYALCAYVRMIYAAVYITFNKSHKEHIDIIFCDQISACIPVLKFAANHPKIIFYCHFPDLLQSIKTGILKMLYRYPLDYLEEITTGCADRILVNSKFTREVFKTTFKRLNIIPNVLYPSINTNFLDSKTISDGVINSLKFSEDHFVFLSINRYERKKNLKLAIEAFNELKLTLSPAEWEKCHLIIAGGYDIRLIENVEYYNELKKLKNELELSGKVTLLCSPSDNQKIFLLKTCNCLLYTPENEHFGIVPLEGMCMSKPVIAANSGGPTETIIHESTGFLCEPNKKTFAKYMLKLVEDRSLSKRMGSMGRKHVLQKFSFEEFGDKLEHIINELMSIEKNSNIKID